jgi:hypothetical protein
LAPLYHAALARGLAQPLAAIPQLERVKRDMARNSGKGFRRGSR